MTSEMRAESVVDLLRLFEAAGIDVWLDGGWAVDAALGEQTRSHKDLDIILQCTDLPRLREILGARVLGEFGDDPNRYADAKARKNYAGTAPITRASGAPRRTACA